MGVIALVLVALPVALFLAPSQLPPADASSPSAGVQDVHRARPTDRSAPPPGSTQRSAVDENRVPLEQMPASSPAGSANAHTPAAAPELSSSSSGAEKRATPPGWPSAAPKRDVAPRRQSSTSPGQPGLFKDPDF
jgi:hypothetical protein